MANPKPARFQVRVGVRVRPFLSSEAEANDSNSSLTPCATVVHTDDRSRSSGEVTVLIKDQYSSRNECYKLDSFFDQDDALGQMFQREVSNVIPRVLEGFNATVFAYGATGSGKTYTMQGTDAHPGLIPLSLSMIFSLCEISRCSVEMSYYEVYMDKCYDLLEPKSKEIMVLEDKDGQVQLKGLSKLRVKSMAEFNQAFSSSVQRKKVAHTGLNDVSSRSHGVLSVHVTKDSVTGKLNLIDLAGNEDNRRTGNEGIRLQESAKINQSLFALSNVIYALNNNGTRVPYRESKLTRILQDSLGGNSRALMIACLNPGSYPEAVHTVSLAARSRHVVNYMESCPKLRTPKVKVDMDAKLRVWLESKGKTKSVPRSNASRSPFLGKGSNSMSCRKRLEMIRSSTKSTAKDQEESVSRKLFDSVVPPTAISGDENFLPNMEARGDASSTVGRVGTYKEGAYHNGAYKENSRTLNDEGSRYYARDTAIGQKESINPNIETSPFSGNAKEVHSSLQKVLSPVNFNTTPVKCFPFDEGQCCLVDQKSSKEESTPKTEFQVTGTPLEKFNELGSNLKESLAKEYLEFLNIASKEELLALKGIGQKRAEYILALREESPKPLKNLSDLEQIGLSSKQIYDMFRRAARGIFA